MNESDWWDIYPYERYPFSFRIQWNMADGNVRALPENSTHWHYANVSVPAKYAETKGG